MKAQIKQLKPHWLHPKFLAIPVQCGSPEYDICHWLGLKFSGTRPDGGHWWCNDTERGDILKRGREMILALSRKGYSFIASDCYQGPQWFFRNGSAWQSIKRRIKLHRKRQWVTAYAVTRHYGGPEEGGWWYNRYQFVNRWPRPVKRCRAPRIQAIMEEKYAGINEGNIHSVLGGAELCVVWDDYPMQSQTRGRPYYE